MKGGIAVAALLALLTLASCGADTSSAPLPRGFRRYQDQGRGFVIALPSGWRKTMEDAQGVNFTDRDRDLLLEIGDQPSGADGLDAATGQMVTELTGGGPGNTVTVTEATLSGYPARRIQAEVPTKGGNSNVEAVVTVHDGVIWSVALTGLKTSVQQAQGSFDQVTQSFQVSTSGSGT
ncbi:MAG TPA: hypothetical protein VIA06_07220 [Candidatus Dormibacteraeota bacterium]|nr:hypothetical protein [Candidatus Dormibacteraeota bacterium]